MQTNLYSSYVGTKSVDEGDCANVQGRLVHLRRTGAEGLQALFNDAQEDAQHHAEYRPVTLHEVAQPLRHRQHPLAHPLAHRQAREYVVRQVRRRLHHATGVARGADTMALAGIGHKIVVPTVVTAGAREAVRKDAAFQVFAKGLAHKGARCVVVALAVELACAGQLMRSTGTD